MLPMQGTLKRIVGYVFTKLKTNLIITTQLFYLFWSA